MTLRDALAKVNGATLALFLAACGTSSSTDAGVDAGCAGPKPLCCGGCLSDVYRNPTCSGGTWTCPSGSVTEDQCVCKTIPFCVLPKDRCLSCADGGYVEKTCTSAGRICPTGSYDPAAPDGGMCVEDASAD